MIAKFNDTCRGCGGPIALGDEITWTPEGGPRCEDCGPAQPDERRGTKSAAEDETGAERTARLQREGQAQTLADLQQQVEQLKQQLRLLCMWATEIGEGLGISPSQELNPYRME